MSKQMSEREKTYFIAILFPIFWPFIPALIICDLAEAIGHGARWLAKKARRGRCWTRGYHVLDKDGVYKFRYDCPGMCWTCGKVGDGIMPDEGE